MNGEHGDTASADDLGELPELERADDDIAREAAGAQPGERPAPGMPTAQDEKKATLGFAAMLVAMGVGIAKRQWPAITFEREELLEATGKLAPVLEKYNLRSALMDKYAAEFELAAFLVGLAMAKSAQLKKTHEHEPDNKASGAPGGGGSGSAFDNLSGFTRGNAGQP